MIIALNKRLCLIFFTLLCNLVLHSQTELEVKFDKSSKTLKKVNDDDIDRNESFSIKVSNINTGYIDVLFNVKNKKIISTAPPTIAAILPTIVEGINLGSPDFSMGVVTNNDSSEILNALIDSIEVRVKRLECLRRNSKKLYQSLKTGSTGYKELITTILKSYNISQKVISDEEIAQEFKRKILVDIHYLENAKVFFSGYLTKIAKVQHLNNNRLLHFSSVIESFYTTYKQEEFLKYWKLLVKSSDIRTDVSSSTIYKATEEILETEIVLLNSFTNDTILTQKIDFFTSGKLWKLSFSSGFVYNSITEDEYYLSERNDSLSNVLNENTDKSDVSIGALAHLNYKISSFTGVGFTIGLGVSPFDGQTRYLMGSNVLLGRKNQIGISFGAALSRIDALSDTIMEDDLGKYIPKEEEIKTFKKLKWGYFIGLTYNLTNKKK